MRVSRTLAYKIAHIAVPLSCVAVVLALLVLLDARPVTALLVALAFLAPGRVQGYFWRTFFRGRRALGAGQWEAAIRHFESFLDPASPLPCFNLAVLAQATSEEEEARRLLGRATELGYRRTSLDQVIHTAGAVLARVEGR